MNDIEVIPVWTGADGWLIHDFGKGALVPPYARESSLTEATRPRHERSLNPMIRPQSRHGGGKPRKYSSAIREAVRELRAQGLTCQKIAARFQIPHGTVYGWVAGRNGR